MGSRALRDATPEQRQAFLETHPQARARDMVPMVEHAVAGKVQTLGLPVKFSATPGGVASGAPTLGQHSRDVLAEAGYSPREIDDLIEAGVVGQPSRPMQADKP